MQNLAGHKRATELATEELTRARIPIFAADPKGEVGAAVEGRIGDHTFRRAWYYWIVEGPTPLDLARELYADSVGVTDVRVAGMSGNDDPDRWAEWRDAHGVQLISDPKGDREHEWNEFVGRHPELANGERFRYVPDPSQVPGVRGFVMSYHVDSEVGLRLLADTLHKHYGARPVLEAVA